MDWSQFWLDVQTFLTTSGWQLVQTVLVLIIGIIVVKVLIAVIKRAFRRSTMDAITQSFLNSIIKYALYIVLWIIVLQILGVPSTTFIAALSTIGLAIGLALKDSLSNLANGIIIITTKPFSKDEYIAIGDVEGKVKSIQILTTTLTTKDNKDVILPNSDIVSKAITNYSKSPVRRVDFHFSVAYESDLQKVYNTILSVINSDGRTFKDPAPKVVLNQMGDSGLDIFAYCWCDNVDYWDVYWNIQELVFSEFNRNNISIPYNQIDVRMRNNDEVENVKLFSKDKLPTRVEKVRTKEEKSALEDIFGVNFDKFKNFKKLKRKPKNTKYTKQLTSTKVVETTSTSIDENAKPD